MVKHTAPEIKNVLNASSARKAYRNTLSELEGLLVSNVLLSKGFVLRERTVSLRKPATPQQECRSSKLFAANLREMTPGRP
jgi:hypothetical protein